MLADNNYTSWLKSQPGTIKWLQDNHVTIYNFITTGTPVVQDTPEHNRLQARFLDKSFCEAFLTLIDDAKQLYEIEIGFEPRGGYDIYLYVRPSIKLTTGEVHTYWTINKVRIEIKPQLGDDYPSVLRQMRHNQPLNQLSYYDVLLIGRFESESINLDQLRGIFGNYRVVLLSEIEEKLAS